MSRIAHDAGKEARIEQMQDRVLDATDILIDGKPIIRSLTVCRLFGLRRAETREIPGGIDEGIHRVRLTPRGTLAFGTGHVLPARMMIERIAGPVESRVIGQAHGQFLARHRHGAASRAMDDRDGAAPITLARNAPIAQTIAHIARTAPRRLQPSRDDRLGLLDAFSVEEFGIGDDAVAGIGRAVERKIGRINIPGHDDGTDRKPVFAGEFEIALIMGGAAEDGAGAIFHQHEIRDIDRHRHIGLEGMAHLEAGVVAFFLRRFDRGLGGAVTLAGRSESRELRVAPRRARLQADDRRRSRKSSCRKSCRAAS